LGFPTARRGNEKWKYTNVAQIAKTPFSYSTHLDTDVEFEAVDLPQVAPWEEGWINLVFIDGQFSQALSTVPETRRGIQVSSLRQAIQSDGDAVEQHLAKHACFQDDGFTALNTAFLNDGAFVKVPDGCEASAVVNLVFVTTDRREPAVCYPRTLVVVGRDTGLTLVESYVSWGGGRYFTNAVSEIDVAQGSNLEHYRLLLESPQAYHVGTTQLRQDQDSSVASTSFAMGATLARNGMQVLLEAPGAYCSVNGLYLTSDNQHIDNLISIDHAKANTTSRLYFKGILDGKSKAVFGGQVLVRKDAQKADAQQTDKNLLLSDQAEVDSKPSLLIYADDVKCSHGATAGNIDENALFYLRSRGLDREAASRMLIHSFAREIIETVKLEALQMYLDRLFLRAMPAIGFPSGGGP
jgi:Fe-S cluster assembly protein SufD